MRRPFLAAMLAVSATLISGCGGDDPAVPENTTLVVEDIVIGTGATVAAGDTITVHYIGAFENGSVFESSYTRGQPFEFVLGAGRVIAGWDQGLVGMRVGGRRRLIIPPRLAYGSTGSGPIPPNATLRFEVELLSARR